MGAVPLVRPGAHFQLFDTDGPVRWRLLGGNNRDLGRGVAGYDSVAACLRGLATTLAALGDMRPGLVAVRHRWRWQLLLDDEVVVESGLSFDRRTRCDASRQMFLDAAPRALVSEGVVASRPGYLTQPDLLPVQAAPRTRELLGGRR